MLTAARCLNGLSAIVIIITGIYMEIVFAHVFSLTWKLVVAVLVMAYAVLQIKSALAALARSWNNESDCESGAQ
jgi:hypothetical protein